MFSNIKKSSQKQCNTSTACSKKEQKCKDVPLSSISRVRQSKQTMMELSCNQVVVPLKKMSSGQFIEKLIFLVNHYYSENKLGFHIQALKFLEKDWIDYRIKLNERLNKMVFLEPSLKYKAFSEIQEHIAKEWKKNYVLYALNLFWFNCMLKHKFENPEQFQAELQTQKNFIAQASYMMSSFFFPILQKNGIAALDRLTEETSSIILTNFDDWSKLYKFVIKKLYGTNNADQFESEVNFEFDLNSLQTKKHIIDFEQEEIYPKTICAIKQFISQTAILAKIAALRKFRQTLLQENNENQLKMLREGKIEKIQKVFQKDDFLDITICCIVKGEIKDLKMALQYFPIVLGSNFRQILSRRQVDVYRADLQSGLQYLEENCLESTLIIIPKKKTQSQGQKVLPKSELQMNQLLQNEPTQYSCP